MMSISAWTRSTVCWQDSATRSGMTTSGTGPFLAFPSRNITSARGLTYKAQLCRAGRKIHGDYVPASAACPLADGAIDALEAFKAAGLRQVILSASNLDTLRRQTDERGVTGYFDRLLGLGDIYAKSKVEVGLAYLKENGFDPARAVMIGDSVHDYEVAQRWACAAFCSPAATSRRKN